MGDLAQAVPALEGALLSLDRIGAATVLDDCRREHGIIAVTEEVVAPAMERIGTAWETGEAALSQVYMAGRIVEDLVEDMLAGAQAAAGPTPAMAIVVLEDYHMLGKRIVSAVLRAGGHTLDDWGRMDVDGLVERIKAEDTRIILVSTLMLRAALRVKDLCARLRTECPGVRVVVGGAPFRFDPELWQEVGADATGNNASDALEAVGRLVREVAP